MPTTQPPLTPLSEVIHCRKTSRGSLEYFYRRIDDIGEPYFMRIQIGPHMSTEDNIKNQRLIIHALEQVFISQGDDNARTDEE